MLLFADAENFWTLKTVIDWLAVAGLLLTLFSIWLSWWLAKRDLEKRIALAQRETIERITGVVLQTDVTETGRCLREARELCRARQWVRALDRCEQAMHRVPRFRYFPGLTTDDGDQLDKLVDQLRLLVRWVETIVEQKRTELTAAKTRDLDNMVILLAAIEGKIRASGLR